MWGRDEILDRLGVLLAQVVTYVVVWGAICLIVIALVFIFNWLSVILLVLVPLGYLAAIAVPGYCEWRDTRRARRAAETGPPDPDAR